MGETTVCNDNHVSKLLDWGDKTRYFSQGSSDDGELSSSPGRGFTPPQSPQTLTGPVLRNDPIDPDIDRFAVKSAGNIGA